jgi:hypothetical protein
LEPFSVICRPCSSDSHTYLNYGREEAGRIVKVLYGTAESRTFYRTPAGYTADRKTRRKRNVVCANIFGANVLESRFKIDVVIMIICSIVIIINSVLTLQVSTAK